MKNILPKEQIQLFKERLLEEKARLEKDLGGLGNKIPGTVSEWEVTSGGFDAETSDPNELADTFEELENNTAVLGGLESRLESINKALARVKNGKYGLCSVCDEPININRLEANPAASECVKHANGL